MKDARTILAELVEATEELMRWCVKNVDQWNFPQYDYASHSVRDARALLSTPTPEGWKLVPVEPNDDMQAVGAKAIRFDTSVLNKIWTANAAYRAMIAAAPSIDAAIALGVDLARGGER